MRTPFALLYRKGSFAFLRIDVIHIAFWFMTSRAGNDLFSIIRKFEVCIYICNISTFEVCYDKTDVLICCLLYVSIAAIASICNQNCLFFGCRLLIHIIFDKPAVTVDFFLKPVINSYGFVFICCFDYVYYISTVLFVSGLKQRQTSLFVEINWLKMT